MNLCVDIMIRGYLQAPIAQQTHTTSTTTTHSSTAIALEDERVLYEILRVLCRFGGKLLSEEATTTSHPSGSRPEDALAHVLSESATRRGLISHAVISAEVKTYKTQALSAASVTEAEEKLSSSSSS